jgi:Alginate lyase
MSLHFVFESKLARVILFLAAFCLFGNYAPGGETTTALPKVFYADPRVLADAKARLAAGDVSLKPALDRLLEQANRALKISPPSVMDKHRIPPSGDKHDYVSQAPYFWPDPDSPNHHYIRRDGERNPAAGVDSDAGRLASVCSNVPTLALAYYFTGDGKYAIKAAEILRVFFLDPATRMNPNLNYGQGIPGKVNGRSAGLITARGFVPLMDAPGLLAGSKAWTSADQDAMTAWLNQYFTWLTTSRIGLGEFHAKNNHGSFYDCQAAAIALFLGRTNFARNLILEARTNRIARQIEPDGRQPFELRRTKSFSYSTFNLRALMELASIGQNLGIDLWHYHAPDGGGIYQALAFLAPYADPVKKWPYQQIHGYNHNALSDLLLRAIPEYPNSALADELKFYPADELAASRSRLMFKTAQLKAPGKAVTSKAGKRTGTHL